VEEEQGPEVVEAATRIQSVFRGHATRKKLQQPRAAPAPAAAVEKQEQQQPSSAEHRAATRIQSVQRGRSVRKSPPVKPARKLSLQQQAQPQAAEPQQWSADEETQRQAAATRIQALLRGRHVRRTLLANLEAEIAEPEAAADAAASTEASQPAAPALSEPSSDEHRAATKLQALARGRSVRQKNKQQQQQQQQLPPAEPSQPQEAAQQQPTYSAAEHIAATRIQSIQRGRSVRKQSSVKPPARKIAAAALVPDAVDAQEQAEAVQQQPSSAEHRAATRIQSVQRGRSVRKSPPAKLARELPLQQPLDPAALL